MSRQPKTKGKKKDEFDRVARLEILVMETLQSRPGLTTSQIADLLGRTRQYAVVLLRGLASAECVVKAPACVVGSRKSRPVWYVAPLED